MHTQNSQSPAKKRPHFTHKKRPFAVDKSQNFYDRPQRDNRSERDPRNSSEKRFERYGRNDRFDRDNRASGETGDSRRNFRGNSYGRSDNDNRDSKKFYKKDYNTNTDTKNESEGAPFERKRSFAGNRFSKGNTKSNNNQKGFHRSKYKDPKPEYNVEPKFSVIAQAKKAAPLAETKSTIQFGDLNLPEAVQKALREMNFSNPTPIQEKSIPSALEGRDVMGCAQTGTGKTAAFSLPMLVRLINNTNELALVLAPTRELAQQILETVRKIAKHTNIQSTLIVGGASFNEQVRNLRKNPRIVIATPGRLVDHLQQKTIHLKEVKYLVLDEADRMLDMGFAPQLEKILKQIPSERQTMLFSATFAPNIKQLAQRYLKKPLEVTIGANSKPADGVEQMIVETSANKKLDILLDELNKREGSVLVFTGTKHRADKLARSLDEFGYEVDRIHGDRTTGQRKAALGRFKDQTIRVLVATDVAARGLDISHVAHVINFDLPNDPEDYIHRIGRTARAGATGNALSFVIREEQDLWKNIQRLLAKH